MAGNVRDYSSDLRSLERTMAKAPVGGCGEPISTGQPICRAIGNVSAAFLLNLPLLSSFGAPAFSQSDCGSRSPSYGIMFGVSSVGYGRPCFSLLQRHRGPRPREFWPQMLRSSVEVAPPPRQTSTQ